MPQDGDGRARMKETITDHPNCVRIAPKRIWRAFYAKAGNQIFGFDAASTNFQ